MNDPTHRGLRGDLWAQARFADLVTLLGGPQSRRETDLLVMLSRLMSDAETNLLIELVRRIATE
jgi:hypothetical protein